MGAAAELHLAAQVGLDVVVVTVVAGAALTGTLVAVAVLWIVPALVAVAFLGSPVLNVVLLGQNYHLVHHAWVSVPWFRYQPVFAAVERNLEAVGARTRRGAWRQPLEPAVVPVGG